MEGVAASMDCAVVSEIIQPRYPEAEQLLNEALARAIYGEIDASTAITEAALEAESLLQQ
jgi:hypothetical protein